MSPLKLWIYKLITMMMPETRFFGMKCALLRWCGAQVGENVRINSSAIFSGNGKLVIEDDVWIGPGCYIAPVETASITIGAHTGVGPRVMILTGGHKVDLHGDSILGDGTFDSVLIGKGCWVGLRSTIMPGVSLAPKTLVAAGALVNKSTDKGLTLVAGVPAKKIKSYA